MRWTEEMASYPDKLFIVKDDSDNDSPPSFYVRDEPEGYGVTGARRLVGIYKLDRFLQVSVHEIFEIAELSKKGGKDDE